MDLMGAWGVKAASEEEVGSGDTTLFRSFPGQRYKDIVVVQAVLLFWSYMWVMTPCMGRAIGGFKTRYIY